MITIHLDNVLLFAYHGIGEEEKLLGNEFSLTLHMEFNEQEEVIKSIRQTINYVDVYNIALKRMNIASPLLETVVMDIGNLLRNRYPQVNSIFINLKKLHPPIENFRGSVGVTWVKDF